MELPTQPHVAGRRAATLLLRATVLLGLLALSLIIGSQAHASGLAAQHSGKRLATANASHSSRKRTAVVEAGQKGAQYTFAPGKLKIKVGTKVTWRNPTDAPHTVTSDRGNLFDKTLKVNDTVTVVFKKPGTYAYHCSLHPGQTGKIIVTK
jgi:plastocyanin